MSPNSNTRRPRPRRELPTPVTVDSADVRRRYAPLAERFRHSGPVLHSWCGRGEVLDVFRELDIEAEGVDPRADLVEIIRRKGLRATPADPADFLLEHPGQYGAVLISDLIEHLTVDDVRDLVLAAAGALRPGGLLMVVAASPRNLALHLGGLWLDFEHVRLYPPEVIRYLMHNAGLHGIEVGESEGARLIPEALAGIPGGSRGRSRWLGRLRERATRRVLPHSVVLRLDNVEARVAALQSWAQSLYPAAEYVVTGTR